jgi:hypothetical protein
MILILGLVVGGLVSSAVYGVAVWADCNPAWKRDHEKLGVTVLTPRFRIIDSLQRSVAGAILIVFLILLVITVGILLPCNRAGSSAFLREVASIRATVEEARANDWEGYERAALQTKIIEINREIANAKYWAANPVTSWFYSAEIIELDPIE